eukprot:3915802-Pleurochrysis_carterae.AAC.3
MRLKYSSRDRCLQTNAPKCLVQNPSLIGIGNGETVKKHWRREKEGEKARRTGRKRDEGGGRGA